MKYKGVIISFAFFLVAGFLVMLFTEKNEEQHFSHYWIILALFLPIILRFIFPKLKELEIGTSNFIPNLWSYFFKK